MKISKSPARARAAAAGLDPWLALAVLIAGGFLTSCGRGEAPFGQSMRETIRPLVRDGESPYLTSDSPFSWVKITTPLADIGSNHAIWAPKVAGSDHGRVLIRTRSDFFYFDPSNSQIQNIASAKPVLLARGQTPVSMGSNIGFWGGFLKSELMPDDTTNDQPTNTGFTFEPTNGQFAEITDVGAPSLRQNPLQVWLDQALLVWGGYEPYSREAVLPFGAVFSPATGFWRPVSNKFGAVAPWAGAFGLWNGIEFFLWDREKVDSDIHLSQIWAYSPVSDKWRTVEYSGRPRRTWAHRGLAVGPKAYFISKERQDAPSGTAARYYFALSAYDTLSGTWESLPASDFFDGREEDGVQFVTDGISLFIWELSGPFGQQKPVLGVYSLQTQKWTLAPTALSTGPGVKTPYCSNATYGGQSWTASPYGMVIWGGSWSCVSPSGASEVSETASWLLKFN